MPPILTVGCARPLVAASSTGMRSAEAMISVEARHVARDDRFGRAAARLDQGARRIYRIFRLGAAAALPGRTDRRGHEQGILVGEIFERPQAHRSDFEGRLAELAMACGGRKAAAARG